MDHTEKHENINAKELHNHDLQTEKPYPGAPVQQDVDAAKAEGPGWEKAYPGAPVQQDVDEAKAEGPDWDKPYPGAGAQGDAEEAKLDAGQ